MSPASPKKTSLSVSKVLYLSILWALQTNLRIQGKHRLQLGLNLELLKCEREEKRTAVLLGSKFSITNPQIFPLYEVLSLHFSSPPYDPTFSPTVSRSRDSSSLRLAHRSPKPIASFLSEHAALLFLYPFCFFEPKGLNNPAMSFSDDSECVADNVPTPPAAYLSAALK